MSVFWDDLARDLEDPEFRHSFIVEALRIRLKDAISQRLSSVLRFIGNPIQTGERRIK